jgi:hypothetical protein
MNRYQHFKARTLRRPMVRRAYEGGLQDLRIAVSLAELREQIMAIIAARRPG